MEGPASATVALEAGARSELGLPQLGELVEPDALAPLVAGQWANPGAVSARLALLQTTYRAGEDPAGVRARWAPYLVDRLAKDLGESASGAMALAELRAQEAVFVGEVLGVAIVEQSQDRAVVSLTVRRSVLSGGRPIQPVRVGFWLFTLVRDAANGRWLVAAIERS